MLQSPRPRLLLRSAPVIDVLAPAEGLRPSTAHITQFVHGIRILLFARVGVYRRFVNGTASATRAPCRLRAEPLATLYILRGQKYMKGVGARMACERQLRWQQSSGARFHAGCLLEGDRV